MKEPLIWAQTECLTKVSSCDQINIPLMSQSIPTGYIPPPGQPSRISSKKLARGVGISLLKVAQGTGIRQGPGFCEK